MSRGAKISIIILRILIGWFFLYQGIIAILNPSWSLGSYIKSSEFFPQVYTMVLEPTSLPYVSYLVKGLFVGIGALLILGLFVRISSLLGIILMLLLYFPNLHFPYVTDADGIYYIVDYHIIYAGILLFLFAARAGEYFGLGSMFKFSRY